MLAEHLLRSLDAVEQAEVDELWQQKAEARIQAIDQGRVIPIDGQQVLRQLRSRYQR